MVCPETTTNAGTCPDCGQPLQTIWDYPSNEVWCVHCGNRFYGFRLNPELESPRPTSLCILVYDHDRERREAWAGGLARQGCHVTAVYHVRQALEAASFQHFDLVIVPEDEDAEVIPVLTDRVHPRWGVLQVRKEPVG